MVMTQRLQQALKRHREKKQLTGASARLQVEGDTISRENFNIGFDPNPADKADRVFDLDGLTVVMDRKTATLLEGATIDIDETGISIHFDDEEN